MSLHRKFYAKAKRLFLGSPAIPSPEAKWAALNLYKEKYNLKVLVETGTLMGDTVEHFKHSFTKVISIELSEDLAGKAQKRFENDKNVTIIQGDSGLVLQQVIQDVAESILFWLDGHYSSEFYIGDLHVKTARTHLDTPVEQELRTILASRFDHVVLIDDARLFTGVNDYPTISKLRKMVHQSGKRYQVAVKDDIIRVTP